MSNLTKPELVAGIAQLTGSTQTAVEAMLRAQATVATAAVVDGKTVTIPGLTRLASKDRPARTGRNPRTGETIQTPARTVVTAKPAGELSKAVA